MKLNVWIHVNLGEIIDKNNVIKTIVSKLLSEDPSNYNDAPTEGIRRILESETGILHPRGIPVNTSKIDVIRMGTTVATNALLEVYIYTWKIIILYIYICKCYMKLDLWVILMLFILLHIVQRKGERIALLTTAGFGQLQRIGNIISLLK